MEHLVARHFEQPSEKGFVVLQSVCTAIYGKENVLREFFGDRRFQIAEDEVAIDLGIDAFEQGAERFLISLS